MHVHLCMCLPWTVSVTTSVNKCRWSLYTIIDAIPGVSNHWNGISPGLEWNDTNSKIMGYVPLSYINVALQKAILECVTGF